MIIYFILLLGLIQLDEQKYYCINIARNNFSEWTKWFIYI